MAIDDLGARGRRLSDDDTNEDEPLDLDIDESLYDDDGGLEMVEDEDEDDEEEDVTEELPPTIHISDGEEKNESDGFGKPGEEEDTKFREAE